MNRDLYLHLALVRHEEDGWIFDSANGDAIKIRPPQTICQEFGLHEEAGWDVRTVEAALSFIEGFYAARYLEHVNRNSLVRTITDPTFIEDAMSNVHDMDVKFKDYAKAIAAAIRQVVAKQKS
jgi:hypothetical protein